MSRWKASAIHLALSALIIATISLLILWLWYPPQLVQLVKMDKLLGLIALVDVTVGPLLTLLVYRTGKPGLRFDLGVIAALQIGLLAYGLGVLAQNRPVFLVAVVDRLELVTAKDIRPEDLDAAPSPYRTLSWTGARLVGAPLPLEGPALQQLHEDQAKGRDIHVLPRYYVPVDNIRGELLLHAHPLEQLLAGANSEEREIIITAADNTATADLRYLPVRTSDGDGFALILISRLGEFGQIAPVDTFMIEGRGSQ